MLKIKFNNLVNNLGYLLILFLIISYSISPKLFSKININFGIPIYITEFIIFFVVLLFFIKILLNNGKLAIEIPLRMEFKLFYLIFLISLFSGLFLYKDFAFVLRQSALFYYSIFYFLVILIFRDNSSLLKIKFIFWLFFISVNLVAIKYFISVFGINFFDIIGVTIEGMGGSGYFYISLLLIIEIGLLVYMKKRILTIVFFADIVLLIAVAVFYRVRGNWVAIVVAVIAFWIFIGITPGLKRILHNFNFILVSSIIIIIFLGLLIYFYKVSIPGILFTQIQREFLSIFDFLSGNLSDSGAATRWRLNANLNTMWRLITWREMFIEILNKPILGFGFGSKFISGNTILGGWTVGTSQGWVEAHNYFLSFLYRSGFLGLGSFIFIIVNFFRYTFRFLRNCKEQIIKLMIISLMSCIIYILVLGMLEVVLEVPYMGSFLWIIMGVVIVIINYHNKVSNNSRNNRGKA